MPPEPQGAAILETLRTGYADLASLSDPCSVLRYQDTGGTARDREAGALWMARSIPGVASQRVLVCPGVQGALLALFTVLARAGDTICCEAVTS